MDSMCRKKRKYVDEGEKTMSEINLLPCSFFDGKIKLDEECSVSHNVEISPYN